jgi:transcriptional regulator with XRE-family HTH domain
MGRQPRMKPSRLGNKLLAIRQQLGYSQSQMCKALGLELDPSVVSNYELGTREPPMPVVLRYARLIKVPMEMLVDDEIELRL